MRFLLGSTMIWRSVLQIYWNKKTPRFSFYKSIFSHKRKALEMLYFQGFFHIYLIYFLELTSLSSFLYSYCNGYSHTNHRVVTNWCGVCHTVLYYAFLCLILTKIHSIHKWFVPFYVTLCIYVFFHDLPTVGKMWATVNFYVSQIFIHD